MDLADAPRADDAKSHEFLPGGCARPAGTAVQKKEYTFHLDLGIEFLFHSVVSFEAGQSIETRGEKRSWRTKSAPKARWRASRAPYRGPANLGGKIAVVTGGTQGLGEAIARLFAERGAAGLVICGRNAKNGARVASEISSTGCPTVFVDADLAKVADCRKVDRRGGPPIRPRRRACQRRRADRPGRHLRHHRRALQRDFRRQCPRAVLPDPGDRAHHAPGEDRRQRSSISSRCRPMAASRSSPPIAPRRARSPR